MAFHEVAPNRDELQKSVARALQSPDCGIYLDASLLAHCYDLSAGARTELLEALEKLGERVRIPLWAAHETWNNGCSRTSNSPLQKENAAIGKSLDRYLRDALRFSDDEVGPRNGTVPRDQFESELRKATTEVRRVMALVASQETSPEETSSSLNPFIDARVLTSTLSPIFARVLHEGPFRHAHRMPPGHADSGKGSRGGKQAAGHELGELSHDELGKGIRAEKEGSGNQFGDLIIWFEILDHAKANNLKEIVFITRDVEKADWVYKPRYVLDHEGNRSSNSSVTLPLPLLICEAKSACPTLVELHIISLVGFAQILGSRISQHLPRLTAALQAPEDNDAAKREARKRNRTVSVFAIASAEPILDADVDTVTFSVSDLHHEPGEENDLDALIVELNGQDWGGQNRAALELRGFDVSEGSREQRIQLGRALARAANFLAVEPLETLKSWFDSSAVSSFAPHVLLGVLAQVYLSPDGELKKPMSVAGLTEVIFDCGKNDAFLKSLKAIMDRVNNQRHRYLALPDEEQECFELEVGFADVGKVLQITSIKAAGVELVEQNSPPSRLVPNAGSGNPVTAQELLEIFAKEFVVPVTSLIIDFASESQFVIPKGMGFVAWGPGSDLELRVI